MWACVFVCLKRQTQSLFFGHETPRVESTFPSQPFGFHAQRERGRERELVNNGLMPLSLFLLTFHCSAYLWAIHWILRRGNFFLLRHVVFSFLPLFLSLSLPPLLFVSGSPHGKWSWTPVFCAFQWIFENIHSQWIMMIWDSFSFSLSLQKETSLFLEPMREGSKIRDTHAWYGVWVWEMSLLPLFYSV